MKTVEEILREIDSRLEDEQLDLEETYDTASEQNCVGYIDALADLKKWILE